MGQEAISGLGFVPHGRRLAETLRRADAFAREARNSRLSLDHLVLALTDDTDAARVLEANGTAVTALRDHLLHQIVHASDRAADASRPVVPDEEVQRIFDVGSAAATASGRPEMDGALVVAAIIGEGASRTAQTLRDFGLSVDDDVEERSDGSAAGTHAGFGADAQGTSASVMRDVTGEQRAAAFGGPERSREDLSDIHRLLAQPIVEPVTGPASSQAAAAVNGHEITHARSAPGMAASTSPHVKGHTAGATHVNRAAQPEGLPPIMRTRPKERVPQHVAPAPRTVLQPETAIPSEPSAQQATQQATRHAAQQAGQQAAPGAAAAPPGVVATPADAGASAMGARSSAAGATLVAAGVATTEPMQRPPAPVTGEVPPPPPSPAPPQRGPAEQDAVDAVASGSDALVGTAQLDVNVLEEIVPDKLRRGVSEQLEIQVLDSDIALLTGTFEGSDLPYDAGEIVSRALSLRLHSPSGHFAIETRSPEVHWLDTTGPVHADDTTSWRWQLMPQTLGRGRLQLTGMARSVTREGRVFQMVLPEQSIDVRVTRGFGPAFRKIAFVVFLLALGGVGGAVARPALRLAGLL
ncbi:MAG: Clp protease N-terminal domain-containing protein [Pseudomonadota bacterium]